MPGKVVLVRHGATKFNRGGESAEKIRGWLDVPLDGEGMREAEKLGKQLCGKPVESLFCSPLARARETAERIGEKCQLAPHPNVSLLPWNLGQLQGETVASVVDTMNYYVRNEERAPQGGEPFATFRKRFLTFLRRKLDEAQDLAKDRLIVCITHGRCVQLTKAWVNAGAPEDFSIHADTMNNYEPGEDTGSMMTVTP